MRGRDTCCKGGLAAHSAEIQRFWGLVEGGHGRVDSDSGGTFGFPCRLAVPCTGARQASTDTGILQADCVHDQTACTAAPELVRKCRLRLFEKFSGKIALSVDSGRCCSLCNTMQHVGKLSAGQGASGFTGSAYSKTVSRFKSALLVPPLLVPPLLARFETGVPCQSARGQPASRSAVWTLSATGTRSVETTRTKVVNDRSWRLRHGQIWLGSLFGRSHISSESITVIMMFRPSGVLPKHEKGCAQDFNVQSVQLVLCG